MTRSVPVACSFALLFGAAALRCQARPDASTDSVSRSPVYLAQDVDQPPRRLSGPPIVYPPQLLRRHARGSVDVSAVVDTAGRVEPGSVTVIFTPDSSLIDPVKEMMLASRFSPGHRKGAPVRVVILLSVGVQPPRLSATQLTTTARAQLKAHHTDSALATLETALDTAITHPTDGERAYALLVRGLAWSTRGRDSAGTADWSDGLALYDGLISRGVDLAPFLRRLADSVRESRSRALRHESDMPAPTTLGAVDQPPVLLSHPVIHYPPEMQTLGAAGTVVIEAALDTAGRVDTASMRIVGSANHAFDGEALRLVRGSVYRPARAHGRAVGAVIRQAVRFVNY